ncbi:MAG: TonB-dependent receptor [Ferruginibacter sp.]
MRKLITIITGLLCLSCNVWGQEKTLNKTITVNYIGTPVREVLADLQKRYGMEFSYANTESLLSQTVTVTMVDKTAREVFDKAFKPLNISFYEVQNTIVIKADKPNTVKGKAESSLVTLSGFVREKGTLETLPGASVYIPAFQYGAISNNYGFYSLTVPAGQYEIEYSFVGFQKVSEKLLLNQSLKLDAFMEQAEMLQEVITSANKRLPVSIDTRMSTVDISMASVKRLPSLAGEKDVFKVLQMYPGVQRGVEGTSGFYVRGGTVDQNMIILDDAPVYNANHAFGFFSVFNGDAIKSAELIKGGFPARYGERLSSVLVMNMKDGNKEQLSGEIGVGLISSRFTFEGPIQKGKSSFLVSGRRTYGDLLVQPFLKKGVHAGYYFYDLNAKINTEINKNNHFYLSTYLGRDNMYNNEKESDYKSSNNFAWGNQTVTARWNHVFSSKTFGNASLIYSNYRLKSSYRDVFANEESSSNYISQIRDIGFKYDVDYHPNPKHVIRIGVRTVGHRFSPSIVKNTGTQAYQNQLSGESINSWENNAYAEDTWRLHQLISLNAGVRASSFSTQGTTYANAEPRVSTRILLRPGLAVKASYALMNQYLNLLSNTNLGLPTDLWVPSTKNIAPQRSEQFAVGFAKDIKEEKYAVTVEGYYKKMKNLISYKEGASFINIDIGETAVTPKASAWEDNITKGKGKSYGAEMLFEKKKGRLTGWAGYTLSWTTFQFAEINGGEPFRPQHDRRHNLNITGLYDVSKRIKFSFNWSYLSGSPITIMQSNYNVSASGPVGGYTSSSGSPSLAGDMAEYSKKGAYVTDAYHRLDIGIQFIKQKKHGTRTWDLSVYNAYAKFNPFYYGYEQTFSENGATVDTRLKKYSYAPFIPSITYSYKF